MHRNEARNETQRLQEFHVGVEKNDPRRVDVIFGHLQKPSNQPRHGTGLGDMELAWEKGWVIQHV